MTSPVRRYGFINAKLRARLSKLLSDEVFKRLIAAVTLEESFGILRSTPYDTLEDPYNKSGDLKAGELDLFTREIGLYSELRKYVSGDLLHVINSLLVYYETENLKNAVRVYFDARVRGGSADEGVRYLYKERIVNDLPFEEIARAEDIDSILRLVSVTPYSTVFEENREAIEETLFTFEIGLDRFYYSNLMSSIEPLGTRDRKTAMRLFGIEIDLLNINWIIRFKTYYDLPADRALSLAFPHGATIGMKELRDAYAAQDVTALLHGVIRKKYPALATLLSTEAADIFSRLLLIERLLEQILLYEVRKILSGYPFTIGILLAYFILYKNEIRLVRKILNARLYGLPGERMRGML